MTTVIVSGAIANKPFNGGAAWTRLSYVLGLRKLGFNVFFVEQIHPKACIDEHGAPADFESSSNLSYFRQVVDQFGLTGQAALIEMGTERTYGLGHADLLDIGDYCALLLNISGHLRIEPLKSRLRRKAYIDLDPGFTQFWSAAGNDGAHLQGHDFYFTVGENIGTSQCCILGDSFCWRPTRPPVLLDEWPVCKSEDTKRFTTVASWRGPYGPVNCGERSLGSKVHEFRTFSRLPLLVKATFEIALDIHTGDQNDRDLLCQNCWRLSEPSHVAGDPKAFRRYVQGSSAEFSVAQEMYVQTSSGWFSDRTTRYLASGKPALVQDTGFSRNYPVGTGLVPFSSMEQAVQGVQRIIEHYSDHANTARQMAEMYFDSDRVLGKLIDETGICP